MAWSSLANCGQAATRASVLCLGFNLAKIRIADFTGEADGAAGHESSLSARWKAMPLRLSICTGKRLALLWSCGGVPRIEQTEIQSNYRSARLSEAR